MENNELIDKAICYAKKNFNNTNISVENVADYLLETDSKRYGYLCTTIKYMGLEIVAPVDGFEKGFIGIGDDTNGGREP